MKLEEFCVDLEARLGSLASEQEKIEAAVKGVCQVFAASAEEVAIFSYDSAAETLYFLWPLRLRNAGTLPLTAHNSLVARTVRENRASLDNSFSTTPHASIFEQFRLGPEDLPRPIQKIMSVPLANEGEVRGVVQVCRKGVDHSSSGEPFTEVQLGALTRIAQVVARHIFG